jgi:hypothetical protein
VRAKVNLIPSIFFSGKNCENSVYFPSYALRLQEYVHERPHVAAAQPLSQYNGSFHPVGLVAGMLLVAVVALVAHSLVLSAPHTVAVVWPCHRPSLTCTGLYAMEN